MKILPLCLLFLIIFPACFLFAEKAPDPSVLFNTMYGKSLTKVEKTSSKKDDYELGTKILSESKTIKNQPAFLIYAKLKAATLLSKSREGYAQAVKTWLSLMKTIPEDEKEVFLQEVFDVQLKIVKSAGGNKWIYEKEVTCLVSLAKSLSYYTVKKEKYKETVKILKDATKHLRRISKEKAADLSLYLKEIQVKEKEFIKVRAQLDKIKKDFLNGKANTFVASYYLLEKGNLFKAWLYLKNSDDELFDKFINDIELALTEGKEVTKDGLGLHMLPLASESPAAFLNWLETKTIDNKISLIVSCTDKLENGKALPIKALKEAILKELGKNKITGTQSIELYQRLGQQFSDLAKRIPKIRGLKKDRIKIRVADFRKNAYVAYSKAMLKNNQKEEVDAPKKMALSIVLSKAEEAVEASGGSAGKVTLNTSFSFKTASTTTPGIGGIGDVYTFDEESFKRFQKEWSLSINKGNPTMTAVDGRLRFTGNKGQFISLVAKKKKWRDSIEISFDMFVSSNPQNTCQISLGTMEKGKKNWNIFNYPAVNFHNYQFGSIWMGFYNKSSQEAVNSTDGKRRILIRNLWKNKKKMNVRFIKKGNSFQALLDNNLIIDTSVEDLDWAKKVWETGRPLLICAYVYPLSGDNFFEIDNLYIGSPKPVKKQKK